MYSLTNSVVLLSTGISVGTSSGGMKLISPVLRMTQRKLQPELEIFIQSRHFNKGRTKAKLQHKNYIGHRHPSGTKIMHSHILEQKYLYPFLMRSSKGVFEGGAGRRVKLRTLI